MPDSIEYTVSGGSAFLDRYTGTGSVSGDRFPSLMRAYPLLEIWEDTGYRYSRFRDAPPGSRAGRNDAPSDPVELYYSCAEVIVRDADTWRDDFGAIIDPYLRFETSTCTPRFVGAAGQLIGTGRCHDLIEGTARSYENCLSSLRNPQIYPEFAIKELILAHGALAKHIDARRLGTWEAYWRQYDSRAAFHCIQNRIEANSRTFGATGEQLRIVAGLGGDPDLVDELLESELSLIDAWGMYHDPGCPMTYHGVVLQQLAMILLSGYAGRWRGPLEIAVRRGAVSSLLMQSVTGQAPFGGRSNQFNHTEAQNSALYEAAATIALADGDTQTAGMFRAAAAAGVACIAPWILGMSPWRHLKQGFHPNLDHGTDSAGPYSIYGILTGSLLCIAAGYAPEYPCSERPCDVTDFAFEVDPCFAKAFASLNGWSVEIDLRATPGKDATGVGRIQHRSLRPEMILSGPIPAEPSYSFAFPLPQRNVSICPVWHFDERVSDISGYHRLADYTYEIESHATSASKTDDGLAVRIERTGNLDGVSGVYESISISGDEVRYRAVLEPRPPRWAYCIPVIETDGEVFSKTRPIGSGACEEGSCSELRVWYRGTGYLILVEGGRFAITGEIDTNRNARYRVVYAVPDASCDVNELTLIWRVAT